jgi:hypothetical protein
MLDVHLESFCLICQLNSIKNQNKKDEMKIKSGNYEVFNSGTVISFEHEPVTFNLADDLQIRLAFKDDIDNKEGHCIEFNPISNSELEIILINFNNSLGTGNQVPLQVGTLNNKLLYLNFRVYTLNVNTNKTIHYCWYLGKEVVIG